MSHPQPRPPIVQAPIAYETANGRRTHAPLIEAEIGGRRLTFVLDTGSEVHLLTRELSFELGLESSPGEAGVDHSGATMASWELGNVAIDIGGVPLALAGAVAIPAPPPFTEQGIAGILSPQHLHRDATAVVDMTRSELLLVAGSDASVGLLLAERVAPYELLALARVPGYASVVVHASVEGGREIAALLNTGGRGTEVSRSVLPDAAAGELVRIGGGVSGADVMGAEIDPIELLIAGRLIRVARPALRDQMDDPQALIGMDVLHGTLLACSADGARPVFWSLPG